MITVVLVIAAIIIFIGIIRIIFLPYTGFWNMIMELICLDWLIDLLQVIISALSGGDDD